MLEDLFVLSDKYFVLYRFSVTKKYYFLHSYKKLPFSIENTDKFARVELNLFNIIGNSDNGNYLYIALNNKLFKADYSLNFLSFKEFDFPISYVETKYGKIFVLSKNIIYVYNENLEKLSKIILPIKKSAHDLLVYKNEIFVLDNILLPAYIFRIKIQDIKQPEFIFTEKLFGTYLHLFHQCISKELNSWFVFEITVNRLGSTQNINLFSLKDNLNTKIPICYCPMTRKFKGFILLAANRISPLYFLIKEYREKIFLVKFKDLYLSEENDFFTLKLKNRKMKTYKVNVEKLLELNGKIYSNYKKFFLNRDKDFVKIIGYDPDFNKILVEFININKKESIFMQEIKFTFGKVYGIKFI